MLADRPRSTRSQVRNSSRLERAACSVGQVGLHVRTLPAAPTDGDGDQDSARSLARVGRSRPMIVLASVSRPPAIIAGTSASATTSVRHVLLLDALRLVVDVGQPVAR